MESTACKLEPDPAFDQLAWLEREFPQTRDPLPLGKPPPWIRTRDAHPATRAA